MGSKSASYYRSYEEDESLESNWKDLAHYLHLQDKRILGSIEKLFTIYNYEALPKQCEKFIKEYGENDITDFAYLCWSVWKALKQ